MPLFGPPDVKKLERKKNVPALVEKLNDAPDWEVRKSAAEALGRIGDKSAIDSISGALEGALDDERPEVCEAAKTAARTFMMRLTHEGGLTDDEQSRLSELYLSMC